MPSRRAIVALLAAAVAAGCAVEHGNQPPQQQGALAQGASPAGGGGAPLPGGGGGGGGGASPGPLHTVFAHLEDTVAIGVYRISLSVVLAPEMDKSAQRGALENVLAAERKADSALAAIRVLGFYPPGHSDGRHPMGMALVPSVILEWVPKAGGWNGLSPATARGEHITNVEFVSDLPGHQRVPGAGGGGGR